MTTSTKVPDKRPRLSAGRVIGWMFLTGLAAALISFGLAYGFAFKAFVAWQALPDTPEAVQSLAGATINSIDVQTASGAFLRCQPDETDTCWETVSAPEIETDERCEPFNRARPLTRVKETLLVCQDYADGGYTALYALRENGRVYAWRTGDSAYEALLLLLCPAAGGLVGLVLGLLIGLLRRGKRQA